MGVIGEMKKMGPPMDLRRLLRRASDEQGASIVEMGVSAAVMLATIIGIFEVSLALYSYHFTADAAREASRWAMVRGSTCSTYSPGLDHCNAQESDIQSYVQNLGYPGLDRNNLSVTATWYSHSNPPNPTWTACGTPCRQPGNLVQVVVTYDFPLNVPFWRKSIVAVSSTSKMVVSQ
jgi:Flp pilus assembly protein TadG